MLLLGEECAVDVELFVATGEGVETGDAMGEDSEGTEENGDDGGVFRVMLCLMIL